MKNHPQSAVAVFAVWEPMLPTDWSPPSTSALARLSDQRVEQFWDPHHSVAAVLKQDQAAENLHPECCNRKEVLWDLIAAYPPGATWQDFPQKTSLFNGTVVQSSPDLDSQIAKIK